jgi:hypothetical protein
MQRKYPVPCRDSARHAAGKHGEVNVIEFDELCKLVEKHVPFMLDYVKKLEEKLK